MGIKEIKNLTEEEEMDKHYAPYCLCDVELTDENSTWCLKKVTCQKCAMIMQAEFDIHRMFKEDRYLRCSICGKPLKPTNYFQTEDCCQHVSTTVKWVCPNHPEIYWDTQGEMYVVDYLKERTDEYINGLHNALGSFARKLEVEIYKKDENKQYKFPFKWTLQKEGVYTSNYEGDILSRKWKFHWIYKSTHFYSGTKKFIFSIPKMFIEILRYHISGKYRNPNEFMRNWNDDRIFGLNIVSYHNKRGYRWWKKVGYFLAPLAGVDLSERER